MNAKGWYKKVLEIQGTPQADQLFHMAQVLEATELTYSEYHRKMDKWMESVYKFGKEHPMDEVAE